MPAGHPYLEQTKRTWEIVNKISREVDEYRAVREREAKLLTLHHVFGGTVEVRAVVAQGGVPGVVEGLFLSGRRTRCTRAPRCRQRCTMLRHARAACSVETPCQGVVAARSRERTHRHPQRSRTPCFKRRLLCLRATVVLCTRAVRRVSSLPLCSLLLEPLRPCGGVCGGLPFPPSGDCTARSSKRTKSFFGTSATCPCPP